MTSEGMGLVPPQRLDNGLSSQLVVQEEGHQFACAARPHRVPDPGAKARELGGFISDRYFQSRGPPDFRRSIYGDTHRPDHLQESRNWNCNGRRSAAGSGDVSEGDEEEPEYEDEDEDEDEDGDGDDRIDEGDAESEAIGGVDRGNKNNNSNDTSEHSKTDTIGNAKPEHISSYVVSTRGVIIGEGNMTHSKNESGNARATPNDYPQQGRVGEYQNAVTIADPDGDPYYSQYLQGQEGSGSGQKGNLLDNACGFRGKKDSSYSIESGESLRVILSDPVTGALMDDAMILPCGHSFGGGGIQQVIRLKSCYTCSQPVSEGSISPNLSLQAAVQAFCREEELQVCRSAKRRRERFEQDNSNYGDSMPMDQRGKNIQFPFVVTDRVIIKGNKRTPQRFVGREAIVMTQCLNGWYVVKTLDNAESVKLQYRSLARVSDDPSSEQANSKMAPNWL